MKTQCSRRSKGNIMVIQNRTEGNTLSIVNDMLRGLEAQSRADYERCVAGTCEQHRKAFSEEHSFPPAPTLRSVEIDGIWFIVTYSPEASWTYSFATHREMALRGAFDCRESMRMSMYVRANTAGSAR